MEESKHPSLSLELLWIAGPLAVSLVMFFWGAKIYAQMNNPPADSMDVYVVGKQWMWKTQHLGGRREINELHVPLGRPVKLTMTSEDVIHSFYVPAFRVKMDVLPGRYTTMWFEATKPGRYHLFCAEYCGTNHSGMTGWVVVMEPSQFDEWLSGEGSQESPVAAGQKLFQSQGCTSCHGQNGEGGKGPPLVSVYGSTVRLEGGQSVEADESYIRDSIRNPQAQIVEGFRQPLMPAYYKEQLSEENLLQIMTYIKSLAPNRTQGIQTTAPGRSNNERTGPATPAGQGATEPDAQRSNPVGSTPPSSRTNPGQ